MFELERTLNEVLRAVLAHTDNILKDKSNAKQIEKFTISCFDFSRILENKQRLDICDSGKAHCQKITKTLQEWLYTELTGWVH